MIKVLVVDDSALVRKLFSRVLAEDADFEIKVARNGLEALAQLDSFRPDVITLDVQMPQMNGLQCLDRIMVQRPCPVVMVSTVTSTGAAATLEALRLGAVDFVPKPSGAVSLRMQEFAPTLKEKIRTAAAARLPASHRLRERVQFRTGGGACPRGVAISLLRTQTMTTLQLVPSERAWCSSGLPPADRPRSKRFSPRCHRASRGPFSSLSTCRQGSPGRSPSGWQEYAR